MLAAEKDKIGDFGLFDKDVGSEENLLEGWLVVLWLFYAFYIICL